MPIVKEEVARTKWCPYSRVTGEGTESGTSINRVWANGSWAIPPDTLCIGTKCMAWRTVANAMDDDVKDGISA